MKIAYLKSNYQLLTVKLLIVSVFVIVLYSVINNCIEYLESTIGTGNILQDYLIAFKETSSHKSLIILFLPSIGIFINNKIGWILIQSYCYFLFTNLIFTIATIDTLNNSHILITSSFFLLLIIINVLMNRSKVSYAVYNIKKNKLILYNGIALQIGICITIFLALSR